MGCMHINNKSPSLFWARISVELGKRKPQRWNLCVGLVTLSEHSREQAVNVLGSADRYHAPADMSNDSRSQPAGESAS